jgi:hypothetical protein
MYLILFYIYNKLYDKIIQVYARAMDNVLKKVEASIELIDAISVYYKEFYQLLTDKKVAEELDEEIKTTVHSSREKLIKRIKAFESTAITQLSFDDTVTLVFQTYQLLREYENLINKIDSQLTDWNVFVRPDIITSDISQTRLTEISKKSSKLSLLLVNFKRRFEDYDLHLIKTLSDYILQKHSLPEINMAHIKFLQESFRKYPLSIDIYSVILQTIMDINRTLITPILQIIEDDKTFVLSDADYGYKLEEIKMKPVKNPAHRFFGLVPSDVCKPLKELFPDIYKSKPALSGKSPEEVFAAIAAKDNVSIVYMKKFTANPIEFSIWKLTRVEDAANYIVKGVSKYSGLSVQLIDRMKVINYIETPDKSDKWNLSEYLLIGNPDSNLFYIVDSFNAKTFRFLRPWVASGNNTIKVPRSYITGLLTYMNVIPGNNIDRLSIYNELQERDIYKNMFLRQPINIEELVADVQAEMDAPKLKQELSIMIAKKVKTPKNWYELGNLFHSSELIDEFADSLIKLYPTHFKDSLAMDKRVQFAFSETLSTFLVEINNVRRNFARALHERYIKTPKDIQQTIFRSVGNVDIFVTQLIRQALDDVITNKSNVYSSLLMKNKILSIELNDSDIDKTIGGGKHSGSIDDTINE